MKTALQYREYPLSALGSLAPSEHEETPRHGIIEGDIVINGVALPQKVVEELRRLGMSLSWYNAGELNDAVHACHYNSQLVDDPHGVNFRDKLKHSECEKAADELGGHSHARFRVRRPKYEKHTLHGDCQPGDETKKEVPHAIRHEDHCGIYSFL